jgi:hypothetical protein
MISTTYTNIPQNINDSGNIIKTSNNFINDSKHLQMLARRLQYPWSTAATSPAAFSLVR